MVNHSTYHNTNVWESQVLNADVHHQDLFLFFLLWVHSIIVTEIWPMYNKTKVANILIHCLQELE